MRNFRDSKAMATTLREEMSARGVKLSRSESLEITAKLFGAADWNTLSAQIAQSEANAETAGSWPDVVRPFYDRHLTAEERGGQWTHLFKEANALFEARSDGRSAEVLELAHRWLSTASSTTGGDLKLRGKYSRAYQDALADPAVAPKLPLSRELLTWFGPALAVAAAERGELPAAGQG